MSLSSPLGLMSLSLSPSTRWTLICPLWYASIYLAGCGVYCNTLEFSEFKCWYLRPLNCVATTVLLSWKPWIFSEDYWRGVLIEYAVSKFSSGFWLALYSHWMLFSCLDSIHWVTLVFSCSDYVCHCKLSLCVA